MSNPIILRYVEGTTDKTWVMIPNGADNGEHLVFFGQTMWDGTKSRVIQAREVSGNAQTRVNEKMRKGYTEWFGVTFDKDEGIVRSKSSNPKKPEANAKPRLWLKVNHVSTEALTDFFTEIRQGLEDGNIAYNLENDPIYKDLVIQGKKTGQYEYGTQEALILFSLQRRFDGVFVSDDDNEMLPERFSELKAFIKHKIAPALLNNVDDYLLQWGVAMLCIDKPIDLSKIQSESAAAFF
ncbi:MAG: hypothetical protein JXR47_05970 [Thiotrichales bacterium]|nr:hypothetical protein [Thiotrichales bacterium]